MCMNLRIGGEGGGVFVNEQHRYDFHAAGGKAVRKIINLRHLERLKNDTEYHNKFCDSLKGRTHWVGKKHTPETIDKLKKSKNVGENNQNFGKMWITNGIENKTVKKELSIPSGWYKGRKIN